MNMFIKIAISFTILLLSAITLRADHIVGGHIELKAIGNTPGKYRIIMKLYFNALNPGNEVPNTVEYIGISPAPRSFQLRGIIKSSLRLL